MVTVLTLELLDENKPVFPPYQAGKIVIAYSTH